MRVPLPQRDCAAGEKLEILEQVRAGTPANRDNRLKNRPIQDNIEPGCLKEERFVY